MSDNNQAQERPASWAATLAGMLPFFLWGLFLIIDEIPHDRALSASFSLLRPLLWAIIVLPSIGVGVGWVKNFPRWSYPYIGLAPVFALSLMNGSTTGLRFFDYLLWPNGSWGWRAWIPLIGAVVISLLITRSMQPVIKLFTNVWNDWTRLTFALFSFMPLLVWILFDEVDRLYSLVFRVALTLVMAVVALAYLRSTRVTQRVLVLLFGIILTMSTAQAGLAVYWSGLVKLEPMRIVPFIAEQITQIVVIAIIFSPALIGLLHRSANPPRHV